VLQRVLGEETTPPSRVRPGVPRDLETICLKCLQKDHAQRYASALDLAEDLCCFRTGEAIRARRAGLPRRLLSWVGRGPRAAALVGAGVLVLLCAAWLLSGNAGPERREPVENRPTPAVDRLTGELTLRVWSPE